MGRHHLNLGLLLLTFQLGIVSLHASPQSYVPLIRDRAIRDDDVNANIERIFRKDFGKPAPASKDGQSDEVEPSPTELVARAHPSGGSTRSKQPIDKNENSPLLYVVRDAEGKLVPKFADPPKVPVPVQPAAQEQQSTDKPFEEGDNYFLKRMADLNELFTNDPEKITFENGSYPPHYPRATIDKILQKNMDKYADLFEGSIKREPLSTRVDSEGDKYLCNSIAHTEYPTKVNDYMIVNMENFFQSISYETCSNLGGRCSNSHTGHGYELKCQQTYRTHKLFSVAPNANKFDLVEVTFPSCCKCTHVRVAP
uniref:Spaetzle domain-containing protein n=1 Tax=Anopheles arabiensis TaxID=7173 RepID=A0A8W7LVL1_ANOAR